MFSIKKIIVSLLVLNIGIISNLCYFSNVKNIGTVYAAPYTDYMVTEDSYIKNGTDVNTNFGTATEVDVKITDPNAGVNRIGYSKVNFTGFSGSSVTSAKLWMYCTTYAATGTVTISGFTNDSWSQNSITWNSPPTETGLTRLDTRTVGATGWFCFDVTSFINSQMSDKIASFKIEGQNNIGFVGFSSSEAASNKPYLRITTSTGNSNYTMTKDAYIQNGTYANTNFGTNTSLLLKDVDDSLSMDRISYMMADFSSFDAYSVDSAQLYFYVNSVSYPGQVMAYGLTDDSWSETGITWNNRPSDDANAVILGSIKDTTTGWQSIDVTDFINTQMASTDKKATFKLITQYGCGAYDIASKDSTSNKPYLQLSSSRAGVSAKDSKSFVDSMGVNTHLPFQGSIYDASYSTPTTGIRARIDELGVRHLRDYSIRSSNPQNYINTVFSRMLDLATLNGGLKFTVLGCMSSYTDPNLLYTAYTGAGSTWEAVEGVNEPDYNLGQLQNDPNWANDTKKIQQTIWNWVQANHPTLPVVGPAPGNWNNYSAIGDLSAYLTTGNIHSYASGNEPATYNLTGGGGGLFTQSVTASKATSGTKPFMVTETGWHNASAVDPNYWEQATDPNVMAKNLTRTFFYFWNMGSVRTFIYELIDEGTSTIDPQMRFGLLNYDGSVKPAFTAMKNMITVLDDPNTCVAPGKLDFQLSGNTQFVRSSLLQKSNGKFYLALWLESPNNTTAAGISQSVSLTFNNETINTVNSCRIKDTTAMTTVSTRPAPGTPINLTLYDDVTLLEITK